MDNKIDIYLVAFFIAFVLFIIGLISFFVLFKNKQKLALKEKKLLQKEYEQALLQTQLEIQQHTMQNIGQDLHDSVGQKLTLASLYANQIDYNNKFPELTDRINDVGNIISESLDELRSISKNLTASNFNNTSLYNLINEECNRIKKLNKCKVELLQYQDTNFAISTHAKTILIRVVQESINNCLKHSKCSSLIIDVCFKNKELKIIIKDDGIGFNTKALNNNVGLKSMNHRIQMLKGIFAIESQPNQGTSINITIPEENLQR